MNMRKKSLFQYWWIQAFFIILFISFPHITGPLSIKELATWPLPPFVLRDIFQYAALVLIFYLNYFLLVPRLFFTSKYLWYGLTLGIILFIFMAMPGDLFIWSDKLHFPPPGGHGPHFPGRPGPPFAEGPPPHHHHGDIALLRHLRHIFFPFLMVVFLSLILRIQARLRQAEAGKTEAELSLLKAQINPHFLFNTLNSIYALALEKSDHTASAVVRLSGLMRYATTEALKPFVSVEKELSYIGDYIELQLLRLGSEVDVVFEIENRSSGKKIAPMILISFIENAFKHGIGPEGEAKISISILAENNALTLQVKNNKVLNSSALEWESSGMGVSNTKERLAGLYPNRHQLSILENGQEYEINLTIQLL